MNKNLTLVIEGSSHPEFEFFAHVMINGHQVARRGNATEISNFANELVAAAAKTGFTVTVVHNH